LRSFTPSGAEVFGAGHNTLGAWWWLAVAGRLDLQDGKTELAQEIGDAVLSLEVVREAGRVISIGMRQSPPDFRAVVEDRDELAGALGLEAGDLDDTAARVVFTGVPHLLVPAADRATVDRAAPDAPRLAAALSAVEGQGCYLYCRDPIDADSAAYARFFNPTVGIWEDPATGSAAGPLGCQLVEQGVAEAGQAIIIEQGHAIGRPSRIQVTLDNGAPTVSGAGVVVAEGTLLL
jgi:PhzF family phenazine biosynthesis protein